MIIVDSLLEQREREGRPIRVGMIGAGFMAQGLANKIVNSVPGHARGRDLRPAPRARGAASTTTRASGTPRWRRRRTSSRTRSGPSGPSSPTTRMLLCRSEQIDVLVDVTGSVEFGAHVALEAFATASTWC